MVVYDDGGHRERNRKLAHFKSNRNKCSCIGLYTALANRYIVIKKIFFKFINHRNATYKCQIMIPAVYIPKVDKRRHWWPVRCIFYATVWILYCGGPLRNKVSALRSKHRKFHIAFISL